MKTKFLIHEKAAANNNVFRSNLNVPTICCTLLGSVSGRTQKVLGTRLKLHLDKISALLPSWHWAEELLLDKKSALPRSCEVLVSGNYGEVSFEASFRVLLLICGILVPMNICWNWFEKLHSAKSSNLSPTCAIYVPWLFLDVRWDLDKSRFPSTTFVKSSKESSANSFFSHPIFVLPLH